MPNLKELREAKKLSVEDLASQLKVSDTTVTNWEEGTSQPRRNPQQMLTLCSVLGVGLEDLVQAVNDSVAQSGSE